MSGNLPPEIMVEILQRLPPQSLVKFTIVCKTWNSLITDPSFISDHLNRTVQPNGNSFLLLQRHCPTSVQLNLPTDDYHEFYSLHSYNSQTHSFSSEIFSFTPLLRLYGYSTVVGTCNGLVCFVQHAIIYFTTLIIWNPSLRKYVNLRKPIMSHSNRTNQLAQCRLLYGFGFDSRNIDYKVVRLVTLNNEQDSPQVDVYSLASCSWRSVSVRRVPLFFVPAHLKKKPQMFVNGASHWLVCRRNGGQVQNFILSFDVVEERFGELMLPPELNESPFMVSILEGGHLLAMLHTYTKKNIDFFSIWVMKEYGDVDSWREVLRCDLKRYGGIMTVLALTGNGKVVLRLCSGAIVLLDPMEDSVQPLGDQRYFHAFAGPYVESLFFIDKKTDDVLSY